MTPGQVERLVFELTHRTPFVPFVVEMTDGTHLEVPTPNLSIDGGGALFWGEDYSLINFEFNQVRNIRVVDAVAANI